ncbi:MAG: DNA primase, partial [Bacteroidetes bacterium]
MKQDFNPSDWLPQAADPNEVRTEHALSRSSHLRNSAFTQQEDIGEIVQKIESHQIDITGDYSTWRNLGFALSDALGVDGRDYYHRISRFHPEYDPKECDKQFDACLKAKGSGITISTFFHVAKDHGIIIEPKSKSVPEESETSDSKTATISTFPDSIFNQLPSFLKRVTEVATSSEERDILLLGSIVSISA